MTRKVILFTYFSIWFDVLTSCPSLSREDFRQLIWPNPIIITVQCNHSRYQQGPFGPICKILASFYIYPFLTQDTLRVSPVCPRTICNTCTVYRHPCVAISTNLTLAALFICPSNKGWSVGMGIYTVLSTLLINNCTYWYYSQQVDAENKDITYKVH